MSGNYSYGEIAEAVQFKVTREEYDRFFCLLEEKLGIRRTGPASVKREVFGPIFVRKEGQSGALKLGETFWRCLQTKPQTALLLPTPSFSLLIESALLHGSPNQGELVCHGPKSKDPNARIIKYCTSTVCRAVAT